MLHIEYIESTAQDTLTTVDKGPIDPITNDRIVCRGGKSNVISCAERFVRYNVRIADQLGSQQRFALNDNM